MSFRRYVVGLAASALVLGAAGAASATQYLLQYSNAFGAGNFGTVDVTGTSTDLQFVLTLNSPYELIDTGSHRAFSMKLSGTGFALTGVSSSDFTLSTGSISNSPFGGFNLGLNCVSCGPGASDPWGSSLTFHITGTGLGVQAANSFGGQPIYFAADVVGTNGNTGVVGGGSITAVPEPTTWGLMILGFGGAGAALRANRRRKAAAFA